ncbi:MAG: Ig-like domain-containing protein, partial [Gammaproteobacteria bacterium]
MRIRTAAHLPVVLLALGVVASHVPEAHAKGSYGPWVDAACRAFNGTEPYSVQSCALCHTSVLSERRDPEWMYWEDQTLTEFCPGAVNALPTGTIDSPLTNESITVGESIVFEGTADDPDGDPLTFLWNFVGGASNATVEDPGSVVFDSAGTFNVTFTVTDSQGVRDPTPDSRTIRVADLPPACTDGDGDGFASEGGACGQVDCNDADASVNPGATESCSDGIDNNCNALIDIADPVAVGCPVAGACMDGDGDGFNREGGNCGPVDCDDDDATATVQCLQDEACRAEAACLAALFPPRTVPNTAPQALGDNTTTSAGSAIVIDVLANDSDADGDTLSVIEISTPPGAGTA